ncbi:MAG: hypothetical protein D6722_05890 [Bacteroidetes bacterium]|nr:MAG: hypothetical protein D6722_05890 [Bacteroidota bacterium]
MSQTLQTLSLPRMAFRRELPHTDAWAACFEATRIRFELDHINRQQIDTYAEIKQYREEIYDMLRGFRADLHQVVEGPPEAVTRLRETWDTVDAALQAFLDQVSQYTGKDRYERAGVTRTITHINEEYRADLAQLKTKSPVQPRPLGTQDYLQSTLSTQAATAELDRLIAEVEKVANAERLTALQVNAALGKVQAEASPLEVHSRTTTILPETYYGQLKDQYQRLDAAFGTLRRRVQATGGSRFSGLAAAETAMQRIQKAVDEFTTDVADRKDRFYDDYRKKIRFVTHTDTVDELWVRIFLDDIFVDTHEESLTEEEMAAGKDYWLEIWRLGEDPDLKEGAWRALCASHGALRAAWIAQQLDPSGLDQNDRKRLRRPSRRLIAFLQQCRQAFEALDYTDPAAMSGALTDREAELTRIHSVAAGMEEEHEFLRAKAVYLVQALELAFSRLQAFLQGEAPSTFDAALPGLIGQFESLATVFLAVQEAVYGIRPLSALESRRVDALELVFPPVNTKVVAWGRAPVARALLERFVVIAQTGETFDHIQVGRPVAPRALPVGFDPTRFAETVMDEEGNPVPVYRYDEDGDLILDEGMRWLTDFEEAVRIGMGVRLELTPAQRAQGFDRVLALGIHEGSAQQGVAALADLLRNHRYSPEGAAFLPIGAATNNTPNKKAAYRSTGPEAEAVWAQEMEGPLFQAEGDPFWRPDGQRLAEALGLPLDSLTHLPAGGQQGVSEALLMNRLLWPATLGSFMDDMMDNIFPRDLVRRTQAFFTRYVTARGYLPSLRLGEQPYGILPTTAFSRFQISNPESLPDLDREQPIGNVPEQILQRRFDIRLKQVLQLLMSEWESIGQLERKSAVNIEEAPQARFMTLLGLQAISRDKYYRHALNVAARRHAPEGDDFQINFTEADQYGPREIWNVFRTWLDEDWYYDTNNKDAISGSPNRGSSRPASWRPRRACWGEISPRETCRICYRWYPPKVPRRLISTGY